LKNIVNELHNNSINTDTLEIFINYKFQNLYDFFSNQNKKEITIYKSNIEVYIASNLRILRQLDFDNELNLKFIIMLIETCEKLEMYMEFQILFKLLKRNKYPFDKKLEAQSLYIVNIRRFNDYQNNHKLFVDTLNTAFVDEEEPEQTLTILYINFYLKILKDFGEYNKKNVIKLKLDYINYYNTQNYTFLDRSLIDKIFNIDIINPQNTYNNIQRIISNYLTKNEKQICNTNTLSIENSNYSKKLYSLHNPIFNDIRKISVQYIQGSNNQPTLYNKLNRGRYIIDNEELLYQYMFSFGQKHKEKLYDSYKVIISKIKDEKINIIDWGCGQAFATMILLDFAREKNITLDISNICLIEPSKLALERGLLHIDILKQKEYAIKIINSDIDCVKQSDLVFNNDCKTLHLFSNILDMDSFKLNNELLQNISSTFKNDNLFVCVSPNINNRRNNRLDLFYNYFNENFNTHLISARTNDINGHKRYEKVFEVCYIYIEDTIIEEKRQEIKTIQKNDNLDIIKELGKHHNYVVPILNMQILEDSINSDPEYAIFKIRKVSEVITSKIYSQHESNDKTMSFNDKIRYLSYEKKIFNKTITNYVQTLRTIGNRGVHEDGRDNAKLKLDAHLMIIALISFLNEAKDEKLI